jgi:DNA replication protein DnaC
MRLVSDSPIPIGQAIQLAAAKLTVRPDQPPGPPPDYLGMALRNAGIPERYIDRRLDTFEAIPGTEQALAAAHGIVRDALDDQRVSRGMVLVGKAGSGKTHLAVGILRAIAEAKRDTDETFSLFRSKFVVVPEFLDTLRERISDPMVRDPLPALMEAPLVVLDDLGREKPTEWVTDRLYVLVNRRYNAKLPTVVTTNYALSELAQRGYDAMMSRLRDDAAVVTLTASDHRRPTE